MVGRPHRDGVQSCAGQVADRVGVADRRHEGQGAGPEGFGQALGARRKRGDRQGPLQPGDVGDQGIELRPALGLEHLGHGVRVPGVAGQTIDGLGRQYDQLATQKGADGGVDVSAHVVLLQHAPAFTGTGVEIKRPW